MIPDYVLKVGEELEKNGYEAYLVGGSLRNLLMGITPKDYDLTTNALPEKVGEIFPRSVMTGAKYGTVTVLIEDEKGELQSVEVTTFRVEKEYFGGRWPSEVEFTTKLEDDLKRRDFAVNAMALRLKSINQQINKSIISENIVDLFNGLEELNKKVIRAVGDPIERLREDGLRSLRACRLASVYGFTIEEKTFDAIKETLEVAAQVSMERARDEISKLILDSPKPSVGLELMRKAGLLKLYMPELLEGYGMEQDEHNGHDVYQHALDIVDIAPKEVRFAALFHDIGKARTKGGGHFYGHDRQGAQMTKEIMSRLKFSNKEIQDAVNLVRWHMFYLPQAKVLDKKFDLTVGTPNYHQKVNDEKEKRNKAFLENWSDNAIRRMIIRVGGHEQIDKLIKLRIADATANPNASFNPNDIQNLAKRVAEIREQDALLSIKDLKINGEDLKKLGIPQGQQMREILEELLEMVIDDIELNTKEKLLEVAKNLYHNY